MKLCLALGCVAFAVLNSAGGPDVALPVGNYSVVAGDWDTVTGKQAVVLRIDAQSGRAWLLSPAPSGGKTPNGKDVYLPAWLPVLESWEVPKK